MDLAQFSPSSALITVVLLALVPFVAVMTTSFAKIVIVLSLLRNALGLQQTPPNMVINGLAIVLSMYVMYPIGLEIGESISNQESNEDIVLESIGVAKEPVREFLKKYANDHEKEFFLETIYEIVPVEKHDLLGEEDFVVLIPAFITSELTSAFKIGFLIFLPFIVIDLVIGNILMALGMMMLSPTLVSLPFKLLLFVVADGWVRIAHGLVLTYTQ